MNTDVSLIVAVAVVSAFVILHAESIGQWIGKQLTKWFPAPLTDIERKRKAWGVSRARSQRADT